MSPALLLAASFFMRWIYINFWNDDVKNVKLNFSYTHATHAKQRCFLQFFATILRSKKFRTHTKSTWLQKLKKKAVHKPICEPAKVDTERSAKHQEKASQNFAYKFIYIYNVLKINSFSGIRLWLGLLIRSPFNFHCPHTHTLTICPFCVLIHGN